MKTINKLIVKIIVPIDQRSATVMTPDEIEPYHNLVEDLGADSLDVMELAMALEETFDVEDGIPDDIIQEWVTVGDIYEWAEDVS
jgi:acyl carrier protein